MMTASGLGSRRGRRAASRPAAATSLDLAPGERRAINAATHQAYRADIDGLRALAVLPVVFNHAGVRGFHGGYVGVDIFFVISGFLITGILARDIAIGRHSIAEFYRRRILRIFPALFALLGVVTIGACIAMLPTELVRYARSLAATTLFGSNMLFFAETGYFAPASQSKPLLHTWSLAIEEQFYILWPLMLAAIGARRPALMKVAVGVVTAISFAVSLHQVEHARTAAFFLLPARAWELGLGAMLAVAAKPRWPRWVDEALAIVAVGTILYCIKQYNEGTPFPGMGALAPCAAAAILIWTGTAETLVARAFSLAPMVWIGRISYSLYLWHWPVIVFASIGLFLPRTPAVMAGEVLVSIALAWGSWRFVEQPFRRGVSGWPTPRVLAGGAAAMAAALAIAAGIAASGGLPGRLTADERHVAAYEAIDGDRLYRSGSCFASGPGQRYDAARCLARSGTGRPAILFVGDSHGAHLWPGMATLAARYDILQATRTGCKPVLYPAGAGGDCERFFRGILTGPVVRDPPDELLLAARWRMEDVADVRRTLADPGVRRANPVLIGPIPQYVTALPRVVVFAEQRGEPGLPMRARDAQVFETDRVLREVAARAGVRYVSLVDALCRGRRCRTLAGPGVPLQFDYGHLTAEGSRTVVAIIRPEIEAALPARAAHGVVRDAQGAAGGAE